MQTTTAHEGEIRRFNVDEYYRMAEVGIFAEGERVELLEGEVYTLPEGGIRRFNVDEYYRMAEAGIFAEGERVELLEGKVYTMTPQNARHMRVIDRLTEQLVPAVGKDFYVRVQGPITLYDESEPEPDLAVLRKADVDTSQVHHPSYALLVIEVSESSLSKDRGLKLRLYARSGIPEYWVVNLRNQVVEVYTQPLPDQGRYEVMRTCSRGQVLHGTSLPHITIEVESLFR